MDQSDNSSVWQYRFDDTLALYFERLESIAPAKDKPRYREQALYYIDRAWEGAFGDEEIAKRRSQLQSKYGDIQTSA